MASKSVLELAVGTGKWDSGLKKAKAALDKFTEANGGLSKALQTDADKMQKFVGMMGKMDSTAKTAKGQMNDYKSTIEQLTMQYNRMSEAQKKTIGQDYLKSIDQIKQKYQAVNEEVKAINRSLQNAPDISTKGGSLFSGMGDKLSGAMQVFAGNLMTKATMEVANLGAEMVGMVQQGVELAKAGEGIRIAFQRLGRGDILDGLRQATHGTVTDLELMKAAVKFNDFRLPLNELGTMLAFAQQKAKDTGQSVDYMVDSIVTGLGRKSLMILDNLGLSASEIRERMKETGDMTTAVGAIIREQMQKAGDYMETAADRAAQANVNLQNKLEEVGRKFAPIEEASTQLWTSMKIGILDVVSGPLARLLNGLTEAGRLRNMMNDMAGGNSDSETEKQIKFLRNTSAGNRRKRYEKQIAIYNAQEEKEWRLYQQKKAEYNAKGGYAAGYGTDMYEDHRKRALSWRNFRLNYQQRAQGLLSPNKPLPPSSDTTNTVIPKPKTTKTNIVEEVFPEGSMKDLQRDMQELKKAQDLVTSPDEWQKYQQQIDAVTEKMNTLKGVAQKAPEMAEGVSGLNQKAIATYQSMLQESMKGMEYGSTDLTQTLANSIDVTTLSNLLTATMQQGINMTAIQLADGTTAADLWDKILGGENIPDSTWESLQTVINEKLAEMGIDPIKVNFQTGDISKPVDDGKQLAKNWQLAGTAIQAVGSAMSQIEDPAAKVMATIAQAIATIALSYAEASLMAAKNPLNAGWGWIAFAATGAATMISSIAAIHSATGYAEGGMIKGNSYSGDNIMANGGAIGLNAGELVLNKSQQYNLASQLEGDGNQGTTPSRPYVSGEQIYLGLNNYLRRSGRGEIVTSR